MGNRGDGEEGGIQLDRPAGRSELVVQAVTIFTIHARLKDDVTPRKGLSSTSGAIMDIGTIIFLGIILVGVAIAQQHRKSQIPPFSF